MRELNAKLRQKNFIFDTTFDIIYSVKTIFTLPHYLLLIKGHIKILEAGILLVDGMKRKLSFLFPLIKKFIDINLLKF